MDDLCLFQRILPRIGLTCDAHYGTGLQPMLTRMCVKELDSCDFQLPDHERVPEARASTEMSNLETLKQSIE